MQFQHAQPAGYGGDSESAGEPAQSAQAAMPIHRDAPKVGRNDPCPCGSGKKYKQCHGSLS
jgi:preprotein translocase subunit SecA